MLKNNRKFKSYFITWSTYKRNPIKRLKGGVISDYIFGVHVNTPDVIIAII